MLQHIDIKNKPTPINYGIRVMMTTADALGLSFDGLCKKINIENPPLSDILGVVVASAVVALNEGARIDHRAERYTEDDVVDIIDAEPVLMQTFTALMMSSMRVKDLGFTTATPVAKGAAPKNKK